MPSFLGNLRGQQGTCFTLFEIRLDNDLVILRGAENEASGQMLSGKVVLCLPAQLKIEDVHLRLTGTLKVGWNDQKMTASGLSNNRVERTTELLNHLFPAFIGGEEHGRGSSSKGQVLPAGNYEWPFDFFVPGSMAESVEGLQDTVLSYRLKATVARGKLAYDLHAYKAVRIIRTLDPAALELAHAMTVENVWPNKIEYSIVIPQKAIIFGTSIQIDMRFTSLLKGLRIGVIKCFLVESQEFSIAAVAGTAPERVHKTQRDVGTWQFELDEEEHYRDIIDETGQDGYTLTKHLPLPKSLRKCLQDCETHGIKIRHKVKFNVALHNPDGHTSELRATLPVHIFISPNMPIDEQGYLLDQTPGHVQSVNIDSHAPPLYGEHMLDQLYADVDNSGIMTPAPQSGMATPFYSQSRAGSHEDLHSLSGIANGAVAPHALSNRLQDLAMTSRNSSFRRPHPNESGSNTPAIVADSNTPSSLPHPTGFFDPHNHSHPAPASRSNPLSRRTSAEDHASGSASQSGTHTPAEHSEFTDTLSKVPSYNTAVKAPIRGPSVNDLRCLPEYEERESRPSTPDRDSLMTPTPATSIATGTSYFDTTPHSTGGSTTPVESISRLSGRSTPAVNRSGRSTPHLSRGTTDSDAHQRFRILQIRGRAH